MGWNHPVVQLLMSIVGGGAMATLTIYALREKLRETFATKESVDELSDTIDEVGDVADEALELASKAHDLHEQMWTRISAEIVKPLEKISGNLEQVSKSQVQLATAMGFISDQVTHLRDRMDGTRKESSE